MYKKRDGSVNLGCANCGHYAGKMPVNVTNFKCGAGVREFKVFFCCKFLRKESKKDE